MTPSLDGHDFILRSDIVGRGFYYDGSYERALRYAELIAGNFMAARLARALQSGDKNAPASTAGLHVNHLDDQLGGLACVHPLKASTASLFSYEALIKTVVALKAFGDKLEIKGNTINGLDANEWIGRLTMYSELPISASVWLRLVTLLLDIGCAKELTRVGFTEAVSFGTCLHARKNSLTWPSTNEGMPPHYALDLWTTLVAPGLLKDYTPAMDAASKQAVEHDFGAIAGDFAPWFAGSLLCGEDDKLDVKNHAAYNTLVVPTQLVVVPNGVMANYKCDLPAIRDRRGYAPSNVLTGEHCAIAVWAPDTTRVINGDLAAEEIGYVDAMLAKNPDPRSSSHMDIYKGVLAAVDDIGMWTLQKGAWFDYAKRTHFIQFDEKPSYYAEMVELVKAAVATVDEQKEPIRGKD